MTEVQLAALTRYKTHTDSNSFTNGDMQPLLNYFKDEICALITQFHPGLFVLPAHEDLTAGTREYAFPSDVLNNIITFEAAFSQTTPIPYVICTAIQRGDWKKALTEANINADWSNTLPRYLRRRRGVYLLSGPIDSVTLGGATVSNGIRITYRSYPADFSSGLNGAAAIEADPTTTTFGFPRQFHELLARRVAIEYKSRNKVPLNQQEVAYAADLQKMLYLISKEDLSEQVTSHWDYNDGSYY